MNNKKREEEYKLRLKLANQEIDELKTTLKVIEKDFVSDKTVIVNQHLHLDLLLI